MVAPESTHSPFQDRLRTHHAATDIDIDIDIDNASNAIRKQYRNNVMQTASALRTLWQQFSGRSPETVCENSNMPKSGLRRRQ
jgi:hypothetical protein